MQRLLALAEICCRKQVTINLKSKVITNILLVFFILVFAVSSFFLIKEIVERRQVLSYLSSLNGEYVPTIPDNSTISRPTVPDNNTGSSDAPHEEQEDTSNPTIQRLKSKYPEVMGWLTVTGADVSHPFVQTNDNQSYLWTDLDREYIRGGTLFMDYRNSADFSDKLTVIYGHNMRDGTMFGQLLNYLEFDYLLENPDIYISFPDYTAHYTAAACFVVDGADNLVYDRIGASDNIQDVADYIYEHAAVNPDTPIDGDGSILVLSTCNRSYDTARTLLICVPDTSE